MQRHRVNQSVIIRGAMARQIDHGNHNFCRKGFITKISTAHRWGKLFG